MTNSPSPTFLSSFRRPIVESFSIDDLKVLCTELGIDFQNIPGESKEIKALELINYQKNRGQLAELLQYCIANRPNYLWPELEGARQQTAILFLASDPTDQTRLRIGGEFQKIKDNLQAAGLRDQFKLELPILSVKAENIAQELLQVKPKIVHFSGHAASIGLVFEDQAGQTHFVEAEALAALFEQFANTVRCVVLNACFSVIQAKAIARHIDSVIGMNKEIGDQAAIAFSVGFYQALGGGRSVEDAYKLGCVQIRLQGIPEHLTPELIKKEKG